MLLKALNKTKVLKILTTEKTLKSRLLNNFKIIKVLLCFLTDIAVKYFKDKNARAATRTQINNKHELEKLNAEILKIKKCRNEK